MKVDKSKARTPDEEYEHLWNQWQSGGDFFPWDVHPNKLRALELKRKRIWEKIGKLVDSVEFQEYNQWYK